ncbi:unnamed protein product, partial [Symbiodinium sp. CCMP2456]
MSLSVTVTLLSGTQATISLPGDATVADLRQKAQRALQTPLGKLISTSGTLLGGSGTLTQCGVQNGDTITAVTQSVAVAASTGAFALIRADGSVVTWGCPDSGGDSSAVQDKLYDVMRIQAAGSGFAALREDGVVVSWGTLSGFSDSSSSSESDSDPNEVTIASIQDQLRDVREIQATKNAFAAIKEDGSVITWGALE